MNEKMTKLIELATQAGFVSDINDPNKEEKQYNWLVELQKWMYKEKKFDIDTLKNHHYNAYYYVVFKSGEGLISDLMSDERFTERDDALIDALINTIEYMNSPEQCARCSSHRVSVANTGATQTYVCMDCDAITCDGQVIGEVHGGISERANRELQDRAVTLGERIEQSEGIDRWVTAFDEPLQTLAVDLETGGLDNGGYLTGDEVQFADNARRRRRSGDNITGVTATDRVSGEVYFSQQMAEANRVSPLDDIAEDGSTQYVGSNRRSRRYSSRIEQRLLEPDDVYPREVHELRDRAREAMEHPEHVLNARPDVSDYMEVELGEGRTGRVRTHSIPESLRTYLDNQLLQSSVQSAQAELDRIRDEVSISRSNLQPHQSDIMDAMRELSRDAGMLPISGDINPNDEF